MAFASYEVVARAALAQSENLVASWLPEGRQHGDEWISKNPTRSDAAAGSFSVNLASGAWADFATGDKGGDLISLHAYLQGLTQGKASYALSKQLGVAPPPDRSDNSRHVSPVPDSAPEPPAAHKYHGKPTAQWCYRDPDGQVLSYQCRFETPDGKQFSPLTCWQNADNGSLFWRFAKAPGQAPLYGLDRLYDRPDAPVLICEGEKAADAAQRLLPDCVTTTSPNGAKAADKADWRPLRDRQVWIWPDSDAPGSDYAEDVASLLKAIGVTARIAPPIPDVDPGFDAADAEAAGWSQQQAKDYVESAVEAVISDRPARASSAWKPRQEDEPEAVSAGSLQGAINREARWVIEPGRLPEAMDYAEKVLIRNQAGIYQRNGLLVRVETQQQATVHSKIKRVKGTLIITVLDRDWLHTQIERNIAWMKWNAKKKKDVDTNAPHTIAPQLLANSDRWLFPTLSGITTAPTIRPDGSLLQQPGYDAATGLFFDPQGEVFTPIPEQPTQAEGRAALDLLIREVLSSQCESDPDQAGFAFTSAAARSAALSAILTPLVRHSLRTAPLHLISATRPGSGKSLLADVVAMIATGNTATILDLGDDDAEQDKRILTVLLAGDAVINLDNLEAPLGGKAIAKALTQVTFTGRLLGVNRNATAPTTVTWLATGNNAKTLTDDASRRIVLCKLEPQVEAPQDREYGRDLHSWIPANRPALVAAGLTAIRAYIAAGKPKQPYPRLGGFEDWSNLIRSALTWLGEADPRGDSQELVEADPTRVKLRSLLSAWFSVFRSVPTTCKEAVTRANAIFRNENGDEEPHDPILHDSLLEHFTDYRRGGISARHLGEFLSKFKGRIENGARFEQCGDRQGVTLWRVAITDKTRFEDFIQTQNGGLGGLGGSILSPAGKNLVAKCNLVNEQKKTEKAEKSFFLAGGTSDPPNPPNPRDSDFQPADLADTEDF